jgi:hypothetical protein
MTDQTTEPTTGHTHGDESFEWTGDASSNAGGTAADKGREWLAQLQSMIEQAATQAAPVMKEVAAKAAELAAVAGEKAGPVAARAAEFTAEAGQKIAERSRGLAEELRRDLAGKDEPPAGPSSTDAGTPA